MDETEPFRRSEVNRINSSVESTDREAERKRLEAKYGQVWSTDELSKDFEVLSFGAPYVVVRSRSSGKKGSLEFQHNPRFYFNFQET